MTRMNDPRVRKDPPVQFMSVPNNLIGKGILWAVRHYLNKERYSLKTRGRGPKKGFKRSFGSHDTPKTHAKRLGVYIVDRWEEKMKEWHAEEQHRLYMLDHPRGGHVEFKDGERVTQKLLDDLEQDHLDSAEHGGNGEVH